MVPVSQMWDFGRGLPTLGMLLLIFGRWCLRISHGLFGMAKELGFGRTLGFLIWELSVMIPRSGFPPLKLGFLFLTMRVGTLGIGLNCGPFFLRLFVIRWRCSSLIWQAFRTSLAGTLRVMVISLWGQLIIPSMWLLLTWSLLSLYLAGFGSGKDQLTIKAFYGSWFKLDWWLMRRGPSVGSPLMPYVLGVVTVLKLLCTSYTIVKGLRISGLIDLSRRCLATFQLGSSSMVGLEP